MVYNNVQNITFDVITGFDPVSFVHTQGKPGTTKLQIKASWICKNNTSFKKACPMPTPLAPLFNIGDQVQVKIKNHITNNWQGVVELAYWRDDLKSNIYGIRFLQQNNVFGNFFEKNLIPDENLN